MTRNILWAPILLLVACFSAADAADDQLIADLQKKVPSLRIVDLPATGEVRVDANASLTADSVRNIPLDDAPPALAAPLRRPAPNQFDNLPDDRRPYAPKGIRPFRLREFTCEFNYGGWHNVQMAEYAVTHGFSVLFPYSFVSRSHLPQGTRFLKWGDFAHWDKFFPQHHIPAGRYDLLADLDVTKLLLNSGTVWPAEPNTIAMLDLEHGQCLSPDDLRKQPWYPTTASASDRDQFEQKYYHGYLLTYTAPIQALRQRGWTSIGIYPQPYGSGWYDLLNRFQRGETGLPDPKSHWPWLRYGRDFAAAQDVLYPDVYVYYWSPQNVAYTLARIDFDRVLVQSLERPKPIRPYFWPLLHGGSNTPHWWSSQPMPSEDMRAIAVFTFFTGSDGWTLWNWSDTGTHHLPALLTLKKDTKFPLYVMVGKDFDAMAAGPQAGPGTAPIRRYDVLAIQSVDPTTGFVRFQRIDSRKAGPAGSEKPLDRMYVMPKADLARYLRPSSEPVSAAIEGLAMVKPLEKLLRRGTVEVDVPSIRQYGATLPIVRRVTLGKLHILATYDPLSVYDGPPRQIKLDNFAGQRNRTLILPADGQVRIFVLRES